MTIRALIFDVGGVLLQYADPRLPQRWEQELGLTHAAVSRAIWESDLSARATLGQVRPDEVWSSLNQTFKLSPEQVAHIRQEFFNDELLDPALEGLLRRLRRHYQLAVLTNAWSDVRWVLTEKFPISQLVDEIVISAEVGLAKPDPAIFQWILTRLKVAAQEALFIDDQARNTQAAAALGMAVVLYQNSTQAIGEIMRRLEEA